ncbi:MAG: GNAT family N-acetyltransferase [Alphaproteobacteria bacterium PA2]|nr:MAG: GNAT family N-acetyltransferase [Alphaproteobacteria bacterium PA2]
MIAKGDIEAIERATLAGLGCDPVAESAGWLMPMVPAPMGRAKSAVPTRHDRSIHPGQADAIIAAYRTAGLDPIFRMPDAAGHAQTRNLLAGMGFSPSLRPTLVMVADLDAVAQLTQAPANFETAPDEGWGAVFAGPGFDPVEGQARVRVLASARNTQFGQVELDGQAAAVGVGNFNHGWVSIHGMRTAQSARGRGYAAAILAGLARIGLDRGFTRAVLQVEEGNWSALNLYRRAGFRTAWRYDYWKV